MSTLHIHVGSDGEKITVSEMRKQLARILSSIDGAQDVSFTLTVVLENLKPRIITKPAILGAPYAAEDFTQSYQNFLAYLDSNLAGRYGICPVINQGFLARPENE